MDLPSDFASFLQEIRPTENQRNDMKDGHTTLRKHLREYEGLKDIYISDFLQGSYRRHTAVRPKGDKKSDVDIIVVTSMSEEEHSPKKALEKFKPFLDEYYSGKYEKQGRSYGIVLSYVEMDLVITSAPKESERDIYKSEAVQTLSDIEEAAYWKLTKSWVNLQNRYDEAAKQKLIAAKKEEEWKTEPLRIPDREANIWDDTHPLEQIKETVRRNSNCNSHFVNVVKALKWWRLEKNGDQLKHPKSFPLERLIGDCCPNGIMSVAEGVTLALESIVTKYGPFAAVNLKPVLPDYGVPTHDVFKRIEVDEFQQFMEQVKEGAKTARKAFDSKERTESGELWRKLFGKKFPEPPKSNGGKNNESKGGFEREPSKPAAAIVSGKFA